LNQSIVKVHSHMKDKEYFADESFTRANIAVAALLAPLFRPEKYDLDLPEVYLDPLQSSIEKYADILNLVTLMYEQHR